MTTNSMPESSDNRTWNLVNRPTPPNAIEATLSVANAVVNRVKNAQKPKQLHKFLINGKIIYAANLKSAIKKSKKI